MSNRNEEYEEYGRSHYSALGRTVIKTQIHDKVQAARNAARVNTLAILARRLASTVASLSDQREPTTYEDVYINALAYIEEYEAATAASRALEGSKTK